MIAPVRQCSACRKFKDASAFNKQKNGTRFKRCEECRGEHRRAKADVELLMAAKKARARQRMRGRTDQ